MKGISTALFLLFLTTPLTVYGACNFFSEYKDSFENDCVTPRVTGPNFVPVFPTGGKQLSLAFSARINNLCNKTGENPWFTLIAKTGTGTPTNLFSIKASSKDKYVSYVTDSTGTTKVDEIQVDPANPWVRCALSFDLANNKISQQWISSMGASYKHIENLNFNDWVFGVINSTNSKAPIFLTWGSDRDAFAFFATTVKAYIFYPRYSDYLFPYVLEEAVAPALIASFPMNEGTGFTLSSSVGSFGKALFGTSTSTTYNPDFSPTWNQGFLQFTDPNQYIVLPQITLLRAPGTDTVLSSSVSIAFMIKLDEFTDAQIFNRVSPSSEPVLSLDLTSNGELVTSMGGTTLSTSQGTLAIGKWTQVTVFYAYSQGRGVASLDFGGALQTPSVENSILTPITFSESDSDTFTLGGFKGSIKNFNIFSPGSAQVNTSSCLSNCAMDIGIRSSVCAVPNCKANYFVSGATCSKCDQSCSTCFGPGPKACSSCASPKSLSSDSTCDCPAGTYLASDNTCVACNSNCETCSGSGPNACLSCAAPKSLSNSTCNCPSGTFLATDNTCAACNPGCATCSGPGVDQCTSCSAPKILSSTSSCDCPEGSYPAEDNSCAACDLNCKTCSGSGINQCTSCESPKLLTSSSTCDCPDGNYLTDANTCSACDPNCPTCNGPESNQCTSCNPPKELSKFNTCDCPDGQYSTGSDTCSACDPSCAACIGPDPNQCMACTSPKVLSPDSTCLCPDGKYPNGATCSDCDPSCVTCSGSGPTACTSCVSPQILSLNHTCDSPVGYITPGNTFLSCDPSCDTCTGTDSNTCTSCKAGYYLSGSGTCSSCDPTCATCSGEGPKACTSCAASRVLSVEGSCDAISEEKSGTNGGKVAGTVIGVILGIVFIIILILLFFKRKIMKKIYSFFNRERSKVLPSSPAPGKEPNNAPEGASPISP